MQGDDRRRDASVEDDGPMDAQDASVEDDGPLDAQDASVEAPGDQPVDDSFQEDDPDHQASDAPGDEEDVVHKEAAHGRDEPAAGQGSRAGEGFDEFGFTRERVADPDDWTVERKAADREQDPDAVARTRLTVSEEKQAQPFRLLFHLSAITAGLLTLMAAVLHFFASPFRGLETIYVFLATGLVLLAVFAFPLARFPEKTERRAQDLAWFRGFREIALRAFGVVFAVLFATLVVLELAALVVGVGLFAFPVGSLLLARHFILVPLVVVGCLIGALYARMHVPSKEEPEALEPVLVAVFTGLFTFSAVVALFFAAGIPAVVQYTGIMPRQAVYIAGVGLASAVVVANLRLRIPNVVRIIQAEIRLSKQVDRPAAYSMQKRMIRNYVVALAFVVGCIGFLGGWAVGLVRPEASASLDVMLIVLLGVGALFLGVIGVNYVQARQIGSRMVLNQSGRAGPGKKRYSPEQITKYTVWGVSGAVAFVFLVFMLLVATGKMARLGPLQLDASYGTDFFVFALLAAIGPFGYMWAREAARVRAIDDKFPDFLRDLAESQKAGMTLPRALLTASQGAYGPLTKEIKVMASQVEWGISFNEALQRFAERTHTPLIERTVSLVCEAASSGGNVVDILSAASDDAREIKNILVERKQQMGVYGMIIYIAFGVFLTVIGVLNSQFIPELAAAAGDAAGNQVGGLRFENIDVATYQRIFWHAAIVQGVGGGLVSGVMTDGHPFSGLRHSVVMTAIAYVVFRFFII